MMLLPSAQMKFLGEDDVVLEAIDKQRLQTTYDLTNGASSAVAQPAHAAVAA